MQQEWRRTTGPAWKSHEEVSWSRTIHTFIYTLEMINEQHETGLGEKSKQSSALKQIHTRSRGNTHAEIQSSSMTFTPTKQRAWTTLQANSGNWRREHCVMRAVHADLQRQDPCNWPKTTRSLQLRWIFLRKRCGNNIDYAARMTQNDRTCMEKSRRG